MSDVVGCSDSLDGRKTCRAYNTSGKLSGLVWQRSEGREAVGCYHVHVGELHTYIHIEKYIMLKPNLNLSVIITCT